MATDKSGKSPLPPRRLGRGLDALLNNAVVAPNPTPAPATPTPKSVEVVREVKEVAESALRDIPIRQIRANPFQPRTEFNQAELLELQNSIETNGLLQPISVRKATNGIGYELIAGERRLRAVTNLGWDAIPAIVKDVDDKASLTFALIENLQRSDLNPIEEGEGYLRLQDEFGLTQPQIAELTGKDRSTVANLIRVLSLPNPVRKMLENRSLTLGHARPLLALQDGGGGGTGGGRGGETLIIRLANEAVTEGLSVRAVENKVRQHAVPSAQPKRGRPMKPITTTTTPGTSTPILNNTIPVKSPQVLYIENQLRKHLQTDVSIKLSGAEKGELSIQFYSTDDLERILEEMGIELYTDK